ncbi:MAG: DUF1176 domain-containing protein [Haemophilus parainfluenzae]|nr:DUF1176 domain-containing protein [Haemophilus parainfluenzae]
MKKVILLSLLPFTVMAAPSLKGFEKTYQDWDLICDNTGTCNMAGYQDGSDLVSLLFRREAGEKAAAKSSLAISVNNEIDKGKPVEIMLNGKLLSVVPKMIDIDSNDKQIAALDDKQTAALLTALKDNANIEFISGQFKGKLSNEGAKAAMLKMDEFQRRLNTPSALIRQGQEKHAVLAPQAAPKIQVAYIKKPSKTELKRGEKQFDAVLALLRKSADSSASDYCASLHDDSEQKTITLYSLTHGKVLAEAVCLSGGASYTGYYAVMNNKLSKVEQVLENQYTFARYDEKLNALIVEGSFKSGGIGDCWYGQEAAWNGKIFIRTAEYISGSCKGFIGGAWGGLPTFVSHRTVK